MKYHIVSGSDNGFHGGFRGLTMMKHGFSSVIGVVVRQWDECNAYRLKLQGGDEVHAPMDLDCFVTKA